MDDYDGDNPQDKLEAMVDQCLDAPYDEEQVASMSFEETDTPDPTGPSTSSYNHHNSHHSSSVSSNSFLPSNFAANGTTTNRDIFYCENYFDLNDILAQSNRVAVSFQRTVPKLGFLDPGAEDDKLLKGTKLELPLWIVKELNADQVVNVTVPKDYNNRFREILEADATIVDLHKHGPNYYRFGQHLATMNLSESEDIANSMIDTFAQRFHKLVNVALSGSNVGGTKDARNGANLSKAGASSTTSHSASLNSKKAATSAGDDINTLPDLLAYTSLLDNWERELLKVGQATARQMKRWENRQMAKVIANEMVTNMHKRKKLIEQHEQYKHLNVNHLSQGLNGNNNNQRPSSPLPSGASSSGPSSAFKS